MIQPAIVGSGDRARPPELGADSVAKGQLVLSFGDLNRL